MVIVVSHCKFLTTSSQFLEVSYIPLSSSVKGRMVFSCANVLEFAFERVCAETIDSNNSLLISMLMSLHRFLLLGILQQNPFNSVTHCGELVICVDIFSV